ncbi:hypothetical protein PUN28_007991 [Cardiocondyla obscurior]|uniref:Uncharacterized protein n=1 Tax=Cardiocondyla obscurior TaxID=286306 RepID=A0AAW2FX29_9HYME
MDLARGGRERYSSAYIIRGGGRLFSRNDRRRRHGALTQFYRITYQSRRRRLLDARWPSCDDRARPGPTRRIRFDVRRLIITDISDRKSRRLARVSRPGAVSALSDGRLNPTPFLLKLFKQFDRIRIRIASNIIGKVLINNRLESLGDLKRKKKRKKKEEKSHRDCDSASQRNSTANFDLRHATAHAGRDMRNLHRRCYL